VSQQVAAGTVVTDREDDDEGRLYVVSVHDDHAADWYVEAIDATVAEANPEYPATDRVVSCVYAEAADAELGADADTETLRQAAAFGDLRTYTFPRSRLRVAGGEGR
jgi:hypothetical protein